MNEVVQAKRQRDTAAQELHKATMTLYGAIADALAEGRELREVAAEAGLAPKLVPGAARAGKIDRVWAKERKQMRRQKERLGY